MVIHSPLPERHVKVAYPPPGKSRDVVVLVPAGLLSRQPPVVTADLAERIAELGALRPEGAAIVVQFQFAVDAEGVASATREERAQLTALDVDTLLPALRLACLSVTLGAPRVAMLTVQRALTVSLGCEADGDMIEATFDVSVAE